MAPWAYPRIIAHRCGGALAPENTLAGLHIAARLGVKAVEFDVMLSADGVPMLIHDDSLQRTSNGRGLVAAHDAAQLRQLDVGAWHHPAFAGEQMADLPAALALCQQLGLAANIEIKPASGHERQTGQVVAATVAAWLHALRADTVANAGKGKPQQAVPLLLSSFSAEALDVARFDSFDSFDAAATGRAEAESTLPLPSPARALLFEEVPADWQARLQQLDCQALHCDAHVLSPERLHEIQAAGVPLACYTVNDPAQAEALFAAGVAAIFTDRIDLF